MLLRTEWPYHPARWLSPLGGCFLNRNDAEETVESGSGGLARRRLVGVAVLGTCPIILQARGPQTAQTVPVDRTLPREEFLDRERIALTRFLKADDTGAHRGHDLGLATDHPALDARRRQVLDAHQPPFTMP